LINNLGYVQPHPLAQAVRQAAYHACVTVGKPLVPRLLEMCRPAPWQFYANVVMTLGSIDPGDQQVQALLYKAAKDANAEVRTRAESALQEYIQQAPDKQGILDSLLEQIDPALRQFIQVGTSPQPLHTVRRTRRTAKKKSSPKGVREYLPGQKQIEELLLNTYNADALRKIYRHYLRGLLNAEEFPEGDLPSNKQKKTDIAWAVSRAYADSTLMQEFLTLLSEDVTNVLNMLVWEGGECDTEILEKTFQVAVMKDVDGYQYGSAVNDIHNAYSIFLVRREYRYDYGYGRRRENPYRYYLSLPDQLRILFKNYLPPPPEYDLMPVASPEKTQFLYEDADRILQQLPLFYSYIEQGNLKMSKNGAKVLKTSVRQMVKYCRIHEFYEDNKKDIDFLRTNLLIDFCRKVTPDEPVESSPESLRSLFRKFWDVVDYYGSYELSDLLSHLQGRHHANYYNDRAEKRVRATLQTLLQSLPVKTWFAVEPLLQYCLYRDLSLEIIDKSSAKRYLFFRKASPGRQDYYYDNKTYVTHGIYREALLLPFLKGVMFLLATFGLVDITYDLPKNTVLQQTNKSYLSVFDGLRYIRLTPLGAYVLGVTDAYDVTIEEETANVILDEKRLLMMLDGRDRLKGLILEKMADRISDTCYKVSYQSFLKDCTSKQDIEKKIKLFHAHITAKPPQIWQEFLRDVLAKINPFSAQPSMTVYKLEPNKELTDLVARDNMLKKYILKAEAYHIVIESKHLSKVKKRLEEFGYFIDNV
jgi:hypothetical protein